MRDDQASDLVAHEQEAGTHHGDVRGIGMAPEAGSTSPVAHQNENAAEGQ